MASSTSLSGTLTLILRPAERAAPLVELIESAGGKAIVSPVISREPISDDTRSQLDHLTSRLGEFEWVAVTSVNAVSELVASLGRSHDEPVEAVARQTRWATVGPATTRALAQHGIVTEFEASENSAAGMLAQWPAPSSPPGQDRSRVLLPLGDLASTQLEDGLAARGFDCERVHVYRTVSHAASPEALAAWRDGDVDAVVLTSGSIVREFAKQFDPLTVIPQLAPHTPTFVAIGDPTTRTAHACGLSVDIVANQASTRGLFDALTRALALAQ